MDTSATFCLRHTLHAVYSGFVFHHRICALSINHKCNILHTTDSNFFALYQFHFPAFTLCIMQIHTINFCSKKCCFISTGTSTDLDYYVLVIIRVFWKQQDFKLMLKLFYSCFRLIQLLFCKFSHIFVRLFIQKFQTFFNVLLACFIFFVCFYDWCKLTLFFHELTETVWVTCHIRFLKFAQDFF